MAWWIAGGVVVVVSAWALSQPSPEEEVSEAEQQAMIQDMLDGSEVVYEVEGDNTSWASVTIRTPTGTIQGSPDLPMQTPV